VLAIKKFLRILDGVILFLSPIAILFFLLCAVLLPVELSEHPNYLEVLENESLIVDATIDYVYDDGDVHVIFLGQDREEQYAILETHFYTPEVVQTLTKGSSHTIRYVPNDWDNGPVLAAHFDQVLAYRKDLSGLYFLFGISWLMLIIRPDFLYIGYIENFENLFKRQLQPVDAGKQS